MSSSLDRLRARLKAPVTASAAPEPATSVPSLLSDHLRWLFQERLDIQSAFDLTSESDQARLLHWWVHYSRKEYAAPSESLGWGHLSSPHRPDDGPFARLVTILMRKTWVLAPRLQDDYDLSTTDGRVGYIEWFYRNALFREELDETSYTHHVIPEFSAPASTDESDLPVNRFAAFVLCRFADDFLTARPLGLQAVESRFGAVLSARAPELLYMLGRLPYGIHPVHARLNIKAAPTTRPRCKGANMIGYAHGAFGMGEHVKMSARALATQTDAFRIVDVNTYAHERQPEPDISSWQSRPENYGCNVFHVNADAMAGAVTTVGPTIVQGAYNIGYWAWELPRIPENWRLSIDFVDEIWAPSRYIQEAFQEVTRKPVMRMPLCVDLSFSTWKRRDWFGLPQDKFLFLYYFDSHSYYERKNPFAALRAFSAAFPGRDDVGLVIKTQHARQDSAEWERLIGLADGDTRIHILNRTMAKGEILSLQVECDSFVSLHRSEGFGRGPAEAMWLGKPVIVTGWSGNMDFTRQDTALLVDYRLKSVNPGEYPFWEDQSWAEPDEAHAARQMRRLVDEPGLAHELGKRAAAVMRTEYGSKTVGRRYADRLRQIGAL